MSFTFRYRHLQRPHRFLTFATLRDIQILGWIGIAVMLLDDSEGLMASFSEGARHFSLLHTIRTAFGSTVPIRRVPESVSSGVKSLWPSEASTDGWSTLPFTYAVRYM